MFDARDINVFELPSVKLAEKSQLPGMPGIYFVIDGEGKIRYIGLSVNIKVRWVVHHKLKTFRDIQEAKIAYFLVKNTLSLTQIEIALIKHFEPDLNERPGGNPGGGKKPVMTNPLCPQCSSITIKNGKTSGSQRYRCKACEYTFTEGDRSKGRPLVGDNPMTDAERYKRYRQTPENKFKEAERQRKRRARKRAEKESQTA